MYCALGDIENVISHDIAVQLTDDDNLGMVDMDVVAGAIGWADSIIDSYLEAKYQVPFTTPPSRVKHLSADLAVYRLYRRRMDTDVPEDVRDRYRDAIGELQKMQSGQLVLNTGSEPAGGSEYRSNKTADDRDFPKTTWDKY